MNKKGTVNKKGLGPQTSIEIDKYSCKSKDWPFKPLTVGLGIVKSRTGLTRQSALPRVVEGSEGAGPSAYLTLVNSGAQSSC